jgi:hypothetical protein
MLMTIDVTTFIQMTLRITALSIKGTFVTLSINGTPH